MEGEEPPQPGPVDGGRAAALIPPALDREAGAMHPPPEHESPRGPVPEAAEEHGDQEVDVGADAAPPVAAQANV